MLKYSSDGDVKTMFLHSATNKDEKDGRRHDYYEIVLDHSLHWGKKEYKR